MAAGTSRDTKQTSVNNINKSSNKTKPKDPYANYSTAQSMGFGELEQQSQKKDEELSKQGNVGGWEVVTPATPATPATPTTTMTTNENNNKNTKNDTKDETKEMKIGVKRTAPVGLGKIDLKTNENDDNNQDNKKDKQEDDNNKLFKKRKIFNKR